jgi:hypothetical protein
MTFSIGTLGLRSHRLVYTNIFIRVRYSWDYARTYRKMFANVRGSFVVYSIEVLNHAVAVYI